MPCRDEGQGRDYDAMRICELQDKLDGVTKMLCGVLGTIEEAEEPVQIDHLSDELQEWWKKHKAADAQRNAVEEQEKQRQEREASTRRVALSKLTAEERRALGIK